MERRVSRVSEAQWDILLDFLERNPHLAKTRSYNNSARGRAESSRLWSEVAELLNTDRTGTSKTPRDWSVYVSNYKSKLRRTVAEINSETTTDGGPPQRSLDSTEQRMMALLRLEAGQTAPGGQVDPLPDKELRRSSTSATPQSLHNGAKEVGDKEVVTTEDRLSNASMEPPIGNTSAPSPSPGGSSAASPPPADAAPVHQRPRVRLRRYRNRPLSPDAVARSVLCLLQQAGARRARRRREGLLIAQSIARLADVAERYVAHIERTAR